MNPPELYISLPDQSVQVRLLQGGIEPSDYDDNNHDYDDDGVHNDDGHNGDIDKDDENDDAYADDD